MFRVGISICRNQFKRRAVPMHRSFCQAKEKCYIIRTDEGKKVLYESQIMDKFRAKQLSESGRDVLPVSDPWKKLSEMIIGVYMRSKQRAFGAMTKYKVQEKVLIAKKTTSDSFDRKISKLQSKLQLIDWSQQWQSAKSSGPAQLIVNLPERVFIISSSYIKTAQRYYFVFMQSEFKAQMQQLIILAYTKGKKVAIKFYKFIYEAYFEKSSKAIKK